MNYQSDKNNIRNVIKFIITIPAAPIIVTIRLLPCIPGRIAILMNRPPIKLPK